MNSSILKELSEAAYHLSLVSEAIASQDCPDPRDLQLSLLTGVSGCFTTLVQIAGALNSIEQSLILTKLTTRRETMQ